MGTRSVMLTAKVDVSAVQRTRNGGYVYGAAPSNNKDNVTAALMPCCCLNDRSALDRDVIFLAEAG